MSIRDWCKANQNKIWAWIIGFGLVLFAVHNPNQPLLYYAFLPIVGLVFSFIAIIIVLMDNVKNLDLGSRWLYVPLLVIVASMSISGFVNGETIGDKFAPFVFGIYLFGVYLVARILKEDMFTPFAWAMVVGAISCLVYGVLIPGIKTGGWISPTNYDMATGFLVFGAVVGVWKHRWWLSGIALIGLFCTGAPEAVFVCFVLAVMILVRRDWGKRLLLPAGCLILVMGIWVGMDWGQRLYSYTLATADVGKIWTEQAEAMAEAGGNIEWDGETNPTYSPYAGGSPVIGRWIVIKAAMSNIKPFGYGYTVTEFTNLTVHNVPLVVVDQVGITAGIAWLFVTIFCFVKTRWKYAWMAVMALCVFDHFMWTQVAPWWWALAGVSTASVAKSDLVYKGDIGDGK